MLEVLHWHFVISTNDQLVLGSMTAWLQYVHHHHHQARNAISRWSQTSLACSVNQAVKALVDQRSVRQAAPGSE